MNNAIFALNATLGTANILPEGFSVEPMYTSTKYASGEFPVTKSGFFQIDGSIYTSMTLPPGSIFVVHDYPLDVTVNLTKFNRNNFIGYFLASDGPNFTININSTKTFGVTILLINNDIPDCDVVSAMIGNYKNDFKRYPSRSTEKYCVIGFASDDGDLRIDVDSSVYGVDSIEVFTLDSSNKNSTVSIGTSSGKKKFNNVRTSIVVTTFSSINGRVEYEMKQSDHSSQINSQLFYKNRAMYFINDNNDSDGEEMDVAGIVGIVFGVIFMFVIVICISCCCCKCCIECCCKCCKECCSECCSECRVEARSEPESATAVGAPTPATYTPSPQQPMYQFAQQGYSQPCYDACAPPPKGYEPQPVYPAYPQVYPQFPYNDQPQQYQQGYATNPYGGPPQASPYDDIPPKV